MPSSGKIRHARRDCRSRAAPGAAPFGSLDTRRVDGEDVRPIGKIGDAAETFGLALRAENALRDVKPFKLRVAGGRDLGRDFEPKARGRSVDGERFGAERKFVGSECAARPV